MSISLMQPIATRPSNLTDMVLDAIQRAIIDKTLEPGAPVSEASMAAALNVSKTPVREALLRLRHIGLVVPADRGLRVVSPSPDLIRYAYELRAGVERTATSLAGERASADDLAAIDAAARCSLEHASAGNAEGFRACDIEFHTRIAEAANNPLLRDAVTDALTLTRALRARDVTTSGDSVLCAQEHIAISQALHQHDGETAARRAHQHINHVMHIVLAAYAGDAAPPHEGAVTTTT